MVPHYRPGQYGYPPSYDPNHPGYYAPYPYYYSPYYSPFPYYSYYKTPQMLEQEEITRVSGKTNLPILLYFGISALIAFVTVVAALMPQFFRPLARLVSALSDEVFTYGLNILMYLPTIGIPFWIGYKLLEKQQPHTNLIPLKKPDMRMSLLAVPVILAVGLIGMYASSILLYWLSRLGFSASSLPSSSPATLPGQVLLIIGTAVLPGLLEEFAFRGVVMQSLRRYGDAFALLMSSLMFGLMHGNFVQTPFAFVIALAIGYFVLRTGSLWVGIIAHFINNLASCIFLILESYLQVDLIDRISTIYTLAVFALGLLCLLILVKVYPGLLSFPPSPSQLPLKARIGAYCRSGVTITAVVLLGLTMLATLLPTNLYAR